MYMLLQYVLHVRLPTYNFSKLLKLSGIKGILPDVE